MIRYAIGAAAFALAACLRVDASGAQRVKAGVLTCDVSGGFGLIIGSQKSVSASSLPDRRGPREVYTGSITQVRSRYRRHRQRRHALGGVHETSGGRHPACCAGDYAARLGEATIAVGLGANVLVGGSNRTVALQPLSVTARSDSILRSASRNFACGRPLNEPHRSVVRTAARAGGRLCCGAAPWMSASSVGRAEPSPPLANPPSGLKRWRSRPARRPHLGFGRRIWHRTAHEPRVPGALRWWAHSRAARPRCSKRSSPAPARSSARARSRRAPRSATPARKRAITA